MKTLTLLLAFAVPATASPVTFGTSWDGTPPGTFADIVGAVPELGHPDFAAGMWRIGLEPGRTIWGALDTVGFEGDTFCAAAAQPCTLAGPLTQVYLDRPWHLWATTPSYTHQLSIGDQFAFVQTSPTTWRIGLEDITVNRGDNDYQDVLLTLEYLGPGGLTPTPQTSAPAPVPEPFTLVLIGGALAVGRLVKR